MKNLIYNAIKTPDGTILESKHRHDYKTHTDANGKEYMVDGGTDYIRSSANGGEVSLVVYDDAPHDIQSKVITWGSRGKCGTLPLEYKSVKDMTSEHISAVLEHCNPYPYIVACMEKELAWRDVV